MKSGAHFHRCDFQVHTPRDLNWVGERPTSDEERKVFAEKFIAACRKKGLNAVAITDHHDIAFFRFIKEAADNEIDENGNEIDQRDKIIVFPGMELTLGVPCQAILIFDADFPPNLLSSVPTILAINQNDTSEPKHAPVNRLETIKSIKDLCELLDRTDYLRGRYIVLPNVSESGQFSILRKGFASHYKEMPCVGGYVDGGVEKLGTGNREILGGKKKEYGFKPLAVLQTSDNRREDFQDLGRYSSWVKWSVPTAEALRQACLARKTRISSTEPQLPTLVIQSMEVSNSKFLGPIDIDFNPQLNGLIGGRGTGKSTILEYLRWALCDQPPALSGDDELPDFQKKRVSLIENTLLPFDAVITISFLLNNIPHIVRRNSRTKQLLLKIGDEEFQDCHEETIRSLLPIQAYSQKQLSTVGVRTEELNRFVTAPINKKLREFKLQEDDLKARLRNSYGQIQAKRVLVKETERERIEIDSLGKQVIKLREELVGVSKDDRAVLEQHDKFLEEEQRLKNIDDTIVDWKQEIESLSRQISIPSSLEQEEQDSPNKQLVNEIQKQLVELHRMVHGHLDEIKSKFAESSELIRRLQDLRQSWEAIFLKHNEKYETAKASATSHESRLKLISDTEQSIRTLKDGLAEKERRLSKHGQPEEEYRLAKEQWEALYSGRAQVLEEKCEELTKLSSYRIRAQLRRGAGLSKVKERLTGVFTGTRVRTKKVDDLCDQIAAANNPVDEWNRVVLELESLALLDASDESEVELPACPLLKRAGFNASDLENIAHRFTVEEWIEISLIELEDVPVFEYKQREGEYIRFSDASAGQQATALLRLLLNQTGPTLIIDQPEEDIDNPVILEIVEDIWSAKEKRQILFSSHNANIIVNGDADLVICCDYRTAGDQSGGRIKCRGAIDMDDIRGEITSVMEGGKDAFQLRRQKYGF